MARSILRLVSFDITNTLIRVKTSPGKQYADVAKQFGINIDEAVMTSIFLQKYKHRSIKYPNFGASVDMPSTIWWSALVKECFLAIDASLDEGKVEEVANQLYFHFTTPDAWDLLPGAVCALQDLRKYDIQTAVISNWDHRLYKVLEVLRLRSYFDFVLPSYIIGVEKPDPQIFLRALTDAECHPEEAVHFGDNVEKDFIGARNVGMESYLLKTKALKSSFLDQHFVVPNIQSFVDSIRPKLQLKI